MSNTKAVEISSSNTLLNCRIFGDGAKSAICFHGFGQDGTAFLPVLDAQPNYRLYSFDLPFHGKSTIRNFNLFLTAEEICSLVEQLLNEYRIGKFSILAFSIGAKFVFPIAERFASKIDYIGLLAPDGLQMNILYKIATINAFSRTMFRFAMKNPVFVKSGLKLLRFVHLVDPETSNLVEKSTSSLRQGERVYYSWVYLRKLKPDIKLLADLANKNGFDLEIVAGKNDKIISEMKLAKAIKGLRNVRLISLQARHDNVIRKYADFKGNSSNV